MAAVHTPNLTFVHIPKSAGTSISSWMHRLIGSSNLWFDHPTLTEIESIVDVKKSFAVVRNPWDRAVSAYTHLKSMSNNIEGVIKTENLFLKHDKNEIDVFKMLLESNDGKLKNITFEDYIKQANDLYSPKGILTEKLSFATPQTYWLQNKVDIILKYENLDSDFKIIQELCNVWEHIPLMNTTVHDHYVNYYNSETKKIVEKAFEEDIDTWKYTFNK